MPVEANEVVLGGRSATVLAQGSGQPLLLLHGLIGGTADGYRPVMDVLQDRWSCQALWFRGHGPSAWADSYLIEDYGADVIELLESRAGSPTVVVGHSLGSMVAAYVASVRPDLVRAIFLEDCPYFGILTVERHRTEGSFAFFESVRSARLEMVASGRNLDWLAEQVGRFPAPGSAGNATLREVAPDALIADFAATIARTDPDVGVPAMECVLVEQLTLGRLAAIECPAFLLAGNHDIGGAIRDADLDRWRSTMPNIEIAVVADAGHAISMTPTTFPRYLSELESFLDRLR